MRKNFVLIIFIILVVSIIPGCNLISVNELKNDTAFSTVEECIENRIERYITSYPDEKERYSLETIVYNYENENQFIEIFNAPDTTLWMYILDKIDNDGTISYVYNYSETISLYDEWKIIRDYKYRVVNSIEDLSKYNVYVNSVEQITYFQYGKQYESYLLLIDETKKSKV